jgi:hypothetical protein
MGLIDISAGYAVRDPLVIRVGETFDHVFVARSPSDGTRIDLDGGSAFFQVRHRPGGYLLLSATMPDTLRLQRDYALDEVAGYSPVGVIRVVVFAPATLSFRAGVYEVVAVDAANRRYIVDRGAVRFDIPVYRALS